MLCYQPKCSFSNNDAYIFLIVQKLNESAIPLKYLGSSEKEMYVCTEVANKF